MAGPMANSIVCQLESRNRRFGNPLPPSESQTFGGLVLAPLLATALLFVFLDGQLRLPRRPLPRLTTFLAFPDFSLHFFPQLWGRLLRYPRHSLPPHSQTLRLALGLLWRMAVCRCYRRSD